MPILPMTFREMCAGVAQGVINIDEAGAAGIEKGSRVHLAMQAMCEFLTDMEEGKTALPVEWKKAAPHLAGYQDWTYLG